MLAGELAPAGVDVVIIERRASQDLDGSRGGGLHSGTIEVLDQLGIADRFLLSFIPVWSGRTGLYFRRPFPPQAGRDQLVG